MKNIEWLKEEVNSERQNVNIWQEMSKTTNDIRYYHGAMNAFDKVVELIDQLDSPELPEIPDYVADFIKENKKTANHWFEAFDEVVKYYNGALLADEKTKVYHYIIRNIDKYVDAYRYGYTVEDKKYQVIIKDGEHVRLYLSKSHDAVSIGTNDNYIEKCPEVTYLTEQEIKDYDLRYWAFAKEVK